jgi:hypothetical protein
MAGQGRPVLSKLGTPTAVAAMALVLGLAASPDLRLALGYRAVSGIVAGLAVLFVVALVDRRTPRRLVAVGAATLALALGYDAVRGHRGTITLAEGDGTRTFAETGPGGASIGLRPLGDAIVLAATEPDGTVVLAETDAARRVRVSSTHATTAAGYRIGDPHRVATGGARLVLGVSAPGAPTSAPVAQATLREGEKATAADLDITVQTYFPDFAVDDKNQPFTRSDEPRNPAALLQVQRGTSAWRVFVIRAMPGIHQPAGLDRTITLVDVIPDEAVTLAVSREPAAALAALGALIAAVGVAWSRW